MRHRFITELIFKYAPSGIQHGFRHAGFYQWGTVHIADDQAAFMSAKEFQSAPGI